MHRLPRQLAPESDVSTNLDEISSLQEQVLDIDTMAQYLLHSFRCSL